MDLRFCLTPLLNLIVFAFLFPLNPNLNASSIFVRQASVLELPFLLRALFCLSLFLFISADLPLNHNPISFRPGDFSIAVTLSLVASLFSPSSVFWPLHLFIIVSSPCHGLFLDLFKQFCRWFHAFLRLLPTYSVRIFARNDGNLNSPPLQVDIKIGRIQEHD